MLQGLLLLMALSAPQLQNPGFEASELLAGWEVNTPAQEGKGVQVRADSTETKEGRQSLITVLVWTGRRRRCAAVQIQYMRLPLGYGA